MLTDTIGTLVDALEGEPDGREDTGFAVENPASQLLINCILGFVGGVGAPLNLNAVSPLERVLHLSLAGFKDSLKFAKIPCCHAPKDEVRELIGSLLFVLFEREPLSGGPAAQSDFLWPWES
jgi:hypothetical protein